MFAARQYSNPSLIVSGESPFHQPEAGRLTSTVSWPATQVALTFTDWRGTYLLFAAVLALVAAPLHAFALPRTRAQEDTAVAGVFSALFGPQLTSSAKVTKLDQIYGQPSPQHIRGPDYATGAEIITPASELVAMYETARTYGVYSFRKGCMEKNETTACN